MNLQYGLILAASAFVVMWVFIFFHHEHQTDLPNTFQNSGKSKLPTSTNIRKGGASSSSSSSAKKKPLIKQLENSTNRIRFLPDSFSLSSLSEKQPHLSLGGAAHHETDDAKLAPVVHETSMNSKENKQSQIEETNEIPFYLRPKVYRHNATKGILICHNQPIDSEIIYWQQVPGDAEYESPITPHHHEHHDRYLTFEYDQGGWNNVRMGLETLVVVAHATGRTLVIPPPQHLYLLMEKHADKENPTEHDEMGFEDFYDLTLLQSHHGLHLMTMEEFLMKEAVTGGLKNSILPPKNSSKIWGSALWNYLNKVADAKPIWMGRFLVFPAKVEAFHNVSNLSSKRLKEFGGDRQAVYYDQSLQQAHHIHFPGGQEYRLLQHHYGNGFYISINISIIYYIMMLCLLYYSIHIL
jgi:hypothetical protein